MLEVVFSQQNLLEEYVSTFGIKVQDLYENKVEASFVS